MSTNTCIIIVHLIVFIICMIIMWLLSSHGHIGMTPKEYREKKRKHQIAVNLKRKGKGKKHNHKGYKLE